MIFNKNKKTELSERQRQSSSLDPGSIKFTYHSNRTTDDSGEGRVTGKNNLVDTTSKSKWKSVPTYLLLSIIGLLILYSLTLNTEPSVFILNKSNTNLLQSANVYETYAHNLLNASIMNRTKLTINTDLISDKFVKEFPEVEQATFIIPLVNRTPILEILPAQPEYILSDNQQNFIIDNEGVAIKDVESKDISQFNLPVVINSSGIAAVIGKQILSTDTTSFIATLIGQLKAKNIQIQSLTLVNVPYELNVQLKGETFYIKFNLLGSARLEVGTYLATIQELMSLHSTPTQYIDVRVDGRAYYK